MVKKIYGNSLRNNLPKIKNRGYDLAFTNTSWSVFLNHALKHDLPWSGHDGTQLKSQLVWMLRQESHNVENTLASTAMFSQNF